MPDCFNPGYANTRVIIDCTEFEIEIPSGVSNKVLTYSHDKKDLRQKFSLEYLHQESLVSNPKLLKKENQIQI